MSLPVPLLPRDAPTVATVRPREEAGAAPSLSPPSQSGAYAIVSPYRAGVTVAGKYSLVERLGRGGMGEVWRARHVTLHTDVAVKFPSFALRGHAARVAFERFRFEAQVAAHLGRRTPHVAAVHDAGSDASGPYLVMEYVDGPTLQEEIDDRVLLPLPRVSAIVDQVALALTVAHGHGIVHRDLKPSNLLLAPCASGGLLVKVADFGIAKALHLDLGVDLPESTTGGLMIGSPPYMSPEQMGGGTVSPRGDLWSLAVIAYEATTGRLPFPGRSFAELCASQAKGRFDLPSEVRPGVPASVDAWFRRALCRDEARRFPEAKAMAAALREAIAPVRPASGWKARAAAYLTRLG